MEYRQPPAPVARGLRAHDGDVVVMLAKMKGENITMAMLPEFELSPEMERQATIWAALGDLDNGMDEADVLMMYKLTPADLEPHCAAWREKHPLPAHAQRPDGLYRYKN